MIYKIFEIVHLLGQWSYLIIFLAAFLEGAAFMGFLIPGETVVVLSGFLASEGYLKLGGCVLIISLGAVLGDTAGYIIGKVAGRSYFERHKRFLFLKEKHIEVTEDYFRRHGGETVFIGRFMSVLREMVPFTAGMSEMPFRRFLVYEVAGGICWAFAYTLLGYFFGRSWELVGTWAGRAGLFAFLIVLFVAGLTYVYRKVVKKEGELAEWLRERHAKASSLRFFRFFMVRHKGLIESVEEKLSRETYLGIHLVVGFIFSVIFVWLSGELTERVMTSDLFAIVNRWILNQVLYFRTPAVDRFMSAFAGLGSSGAVIAGSFVIAAYFLFNKRFVSLITYMSAIAGGGILVLIFRRAIYGVSEIPGSTFLTAGGWSLPGSNGMISTIYYGMITYFVVRSMRSWRFGVFTVLLAAFVVTLVGMSKIYYSRIPYFGDLLAGYAGGFFWLTICITGLEIYHKRYRQF
jgi:membrane protein DedA with SNARE-associated domain